ncbi:NAD-dependent epimerase/dehydratase family protein [Kibdelosporangium philippinense]|uniref:NAD-dependent epimerase/dehydratase family protein n=1 Tax=Kibdelosporangium philippinense TaxID=211113 RepID=A0ABS8Z3R5_9PSEU|nr:NAD-dependent epimerase/dehydratase family protein [Kibdelosporangium philippinense]MCE7002569.1 NAD-dependent epimerase/dehydratase family protein [Kibdelosporangium philippinense]
MHVIVGATGATGSVVVRELLARGEKVRAVNRSGRAGVPEGVELVAANAADAKQMREVCAGATAVYNCVRPPLPEWLEVYPRVQQSLIRAAGSAGAVLVFADDTWMYGKVDGPMTEDTPSLPVSNLGLLRAWLADMLLTAHLRGDAQVAIARAGELYGPKVESLFGSPMFAGKRPMWFGNPDLPITPTYIDDFAKTMVTLAAEPGSWGEVWHVPSSEPTTARKFAAIAGRDKLRALPVKMAKTLGLVSTVAKHGAEILYQFEQPFLVDSTKFTARFGGTAMELTEGIARTLKWHKENPRRSPIPS